MHNSRPIMSRQGQQWLPRPPAALTAATAPSTSSSPCRLPLIPRLLLLPLVVALLAAIAPDTAAAFLLPAASPPPSRAAVRAAATGSVCSEDDAKVVGRVQAWIQNLVIGLRLCPFAEGVVLADTVKYVVSHGRTPTEVVTDVMTEALKLVTTKEELVATTVIIAPEAFVGDFPAFYETELFLEEHLEDSPLGDDVLVACFHPQYEFGGEPPDAPIHFEKRSPYPVFNLLRAQRVWAYADEGKTQRIAANNQESLARAGIEEVRRRFALEAPEVRVDDVNDDEAA